MLKTNYSFVIEYYFICIYVKECDCELCDCKIRSLSMCSISCCIRHHVFTSFLPQFDWCEHFFQLLVNYVKVNKTKNLYLITFRTRLTVWILIETSAVELCKIESKDNVMENLYAMFQMGEAVSRLEMFFEIDVLENLANFTKGSCVRVSL